MKNILILVLSIITLSGASQVNSKQHDLKQLMISLHVVKSAENMAKEGMELYKKQKKGVPASVWDKIYREINYDTYLKKISAIFDENYSQSEIQHLNKLAIYAKPGRIPKFKPIVKEQIYNASHAFGEYLAKRISENLADNGY